MLISSESVSVTLKMCGFARTDIAAIMGSQLGRVTRNVAEVQGALQGKISSWCNALFRILEEL